MNSKIFDMQCINIKKADFATASMKNMIFDKSKKSFVTKPENFNQDFLEDKLDSQKYHIDNDLIGTPEYISPEALFYGESSPSVDFWALGCIIYLFFHGVTPFKEKNNSLIFEKIKNHDIKLKEDLNQETKDVINKLLEKDPAKRLGGGSKEDNLDISSLKKHKFFENIDFNNLHNEQPPINLKKVIYSKLKNNNSNDDILSMQNVQINKKESLFTNQNINSNLCKNTSNQNISMKKIDNMKEEIELLYGRKTGDYDINKTPFDLNDDYDHPFNMVDINEECENICKNIDFKHNQNIEESNEFILEGILDKYVK